jgi:predicted dehydrogenase
MSLDRRRFLKEAGVGAATAAVGAGVMSSARADENSKINLAAIGVGGRGNYLLNLFASHNDVTIAALCDVNESNLARASEAVGKIKGKKPATYDDFRRVLDDKSIDAAIIATPHHWHSPIAVRALEASKHLYVEKPASHVFLEGRALVEAAKKHKRVFQHGTQMRSSEVTEEAGKVLASGVLGEIKQSKAWGVEPRPHWPEPVADSTPPDFLDYNKWLGPAPERKFNELRFRRWNNYRDYGNGEIGGDGIHDIDMACWGLGVTTHPVRVAAIGTRSHLKGEADFPDNLTATYEYEDGRTLIYENRNFAPYKMHGWDNGNVFYGTEGYMLFSRRGYFQTYLGAKEAEGPGLRGSAGVEQHIRNFLDSVLDDKPSIADAEVAHLSCGITHLGEIAFRTGKTLQFDPKKERFVDDEVADAMLTKEYRGPWAIEKA